MIRLERHKFSKPITGETVAQYTDEQKTFMIEAGPFEVKLVGEISLRTQKDLGDFAKVLSDAWKDYKQIQKRVVSLQEVGVAPCDVLK